MDNQTFTRAELTSLVEDALGGLSPKACDWDHEVDVWRSVGREDIEAFLTNRERVMATWKHLVGIKNEKGQELTSEQLIRWEGDPKRKLECIFDGTELPLDAQVCPRCREYKGIQPHIPGWSEGD